MTPSELIARKRDGNRLSEEEISFFISQFMSNHITDYQMTAMLMAIYLNGMDYEETTALTKAYIQSGIALDLSDIPGTKVDKHSTGGVGDKVSLILAPIVASQGVVVPMISGRGLGHSGGTLDKLDSIPGFRTNLSLQEFRKVLKSVGACLIGQTAELVPADKRIYALRDVTATVDCIPLISASIMSKKIAEGIDGLVLDVKYGNGAFMKTPEEAESLATNLIKIGHQFGKQMVALLTSMEQPLGYAIGNWLEVKESLECLHGNGPSDLMEVTYELCSYMLVLGGAAKNLDDAREKCEQAVAGGKAFEKFLEITRAQGGDISYLENPEKYPAADEVVKISTLQDGYIRHMNTYEIGMASVELGAGRLAAEDEIDPRAGIILFKKVGDAVKTGEAILEMHTNRHEKIDEARERLERAIVIGSGEPEQVPLILKKIGDV